MLKLLCKGFRILARDVRKNVPELYSAFGRQLLKRWCDPVLVNSEYSPWGICRQAQVVWDYLIKWLKVGDEELPPNMTRAAESEQPAGDDRDSEQIDYNPPPERERMSLLTQTKSAPRVSSMCKRRRSSRSRRTSSSERATVDPAYTA